jgi:17beta-estradiol 17-dehydrogenase / very-long-chain 3-oxoacyl-CoA reductase
MLISCTISLSPYCGTKGFDVAFSKSLWNEMQCEKVQVDVVCMVPGQVVSGMNLGPPSTMVSISRVA